MYMFISCVLTCSILIKLRKNKTASTITPLNTKFNACTKKKKNVARQLPQDDGMNETKICLKLLVLVNVENNLVYVHKFWIKICRNVPLHQLTDLLNYVLAFLRNAINF